MDNISVMVAHIIDISIETSNFNNTKIKDIKNQDILFS